MIYNHLARVIGGYRALLADASAQLLLMISRGRIERRRWRARRSSVMAIRLGSRSGGDDLEVQHEINVTPFIDVILVLLIIFMVAAPLATVDIGVDLPSSTAPEQPRPDKPVFVTVKPDATIAVGETIVTRESLPARSTRPPTATRTRRFSSAATRRVSYGELMEVMNLLRDAGYLKLALVGLERAGGETMTAFALHLPEQRGFPAGARPA